MKNERCGNTEAIALHDERVAPEFSKAEREMLADDNLEDLFFSLDEIEALQEIASSGPELDSLIIEFAKYKKYADVSPAFHQRLVDLTLSKYADKIQEKLEHQQMALAEDRYV